jgi:hypothetical protein
VRVAAAHDGFAERRRKLGRPAIAKFGNLSVESFYSRKISSKECEVGLSPWPRQARVHVIDGEKEPLFVYVND